jgi:FkbM family methyltransferase
MVRVHDVTGYPIWLELYEPDIARFMARYIKPGMIVFDVGANLELFTMLAARRVGASGHVYAFEPSKRECDRLRANVALNKFQNVTVCQKVVSDTIGLSSFSICSDNFGAFNAVGNVIHSMALGRVSTVAELPTTTLDAYMLRNRLLHVDLVKIDAEGSELAILKGASSLLGQAGAPAVVCEFSTAASSKSSLVWQLGRQHGFSWFGLNLDGTVGTEYASPPDSAYLNLVGLKT